MSNYKRTATKFGSGFVGGFLTGGWYGGFAGGTTAALVGGKAKPLKSMAYGAGSGFIAGYGARYLNLQDDTAKIGSYSYKPLSSRAFDYFNTPKVPKEAEGVKAENAAGGSQPQGKQTGDFISRILGGANAPEQSGGAQPVYYPEFAGYGYQPVGSGFSSDPEFGRPDAGTDWLPLIALGGAVLLMGGA